MHSNLQLFCVMNLISMAFGGVKIEITRIKEPSNPNSPTNPITEDTKNTLMTDSTTQTPMQTTLKTMTTIQSAALTASTTSQIQNIYLNTTTTTIIAPTTGIEMKNVSITNATRPMVIIPQMNFPLINFTTLQSAKNPILSELTRRQMRRKLIPFDYYCPCDLKVLYNHLQSPG